MQCGPILHCWKDNWLNEERSSDGMKNLRETRRGPGQAVAVRWGTGLTNRECANAVCSKTRCVVRRERGKDGDTI